MLHSNGSHSLLGSARHKQLPPTPGSEIIDDAGKPSRSETPKIAPDSADLGPERLLAPKSLNRKNIKQLLFSPAALKDSGSPHYELVPLPATANMAAAKTRPAPLLNLASAKNPPILDSFATLEIGGSAAATATTRKRQTVVSLISPTKLVGSPSRSGHTPSPSTPVSTTNLALGLRDDDLVVLKELGAGNFGVVAKVLHVPSGRTMARKVIHVDLNQAVQTQIIRELRIMHECRLPYITEFFGAFMRSNNSIVLCMEYCNCGSLDKIVPLCDRRQFPLVVLKKLAFAILTGLTYLHDTHRIIHRDIKPSNVLMTHRGEFKLCDFGVLRQLTNSLAMADTFVGTSTYMSPERIQGLTYGVKSDVWSMGLMLVELASGWSIWNDEDGANGDTPASGPNGILDLLQRIVNEPSPTLTGRTNAASAEPYDMALCRFVDACLLKDMLKRASPGTLLKDPFLAGVEEGAYDADMRAWAKSIRRLHKERYEEK